MTTDLMDDLMASLGVPPGERLERAAKRAKAEASECGEVADRPFGDSDQD